MIDSVEFSAEFAAQVGEMACRVQCVMCICADAVSVRVAVWQWWQWSSVSRTYGQPGGLCSLPCIRLNICACMQDPETGLPEHRKSKLQDVFRIMDAEGLGKISFTSLQVCGVRLRGGYKGDPT